MASNHEPSRDRRTLRGLTPSQAVEAVGTAIDSAYRRRDADGTRKAIDWCEQLKSRKWQARLSQKQQGELLYFEANAWSNLDGLSMRAQPEEWDWAQEEITNELVCLRTVLRSESRFKAQAPIRKCEILTNLANTLSRVGRTVEALEFWTRALAIIPQFGMALGNRAKGTYIYARHIYDPGHQTILLRNAREDLDAALLQDLDDEPRASFLALRKQIAGLLDKVDSGRAVSWDRYSLGRSRGERQYRQWCLTQRLFLNPLNDVSTRPLVARDVLCLPSIVTGLSEGPPAIIGLFNNLKQEYASARFLLHEGLSQKRPHFSDREVLLTNTLEYPSYGLGREQVKAAFRMAFSVLDKVGYLLNEYVGLGIPPRSVAFRTMWFIDQESNRGMLTEFQRRQNLPMRALYWVSRDLFEEKDGFKDSAEPDAHQLQQIRNHIEHRYLKVHEDLWSGPEGDDMFRDRIAVSIYRGELEAKALRMLKIARAAIIYLVCAVTVEEHARSTKRGKDLVAPMFLDTWEDNWKF